MGNTKQHRITYAKDMPEEWLKWQHLRQDHPELFAPKSTGLTDLDNILGGGIEPGQFMIIIGEPGAGKTTLLTKISDSFAKQKVNTIFFTAEMYTLQLGTMYFTSYSGVERSKIRATRLDETDWKLLEEAGEKISKLPLTWEDQFSTLEDIYQICDKVEEETGEPVQAILGDYVHLMDAPSVKGNSNDILSYLSKGLKRLTKARGTPLINIFAARMSRDGMRSNDNQMNAIYGSSQFEFDMDIGLLVQHVIDEAAGHKRKMPNERKLTVVKSRETQTGDCIVTYNGATATFSDLKLRLKEQPVGGYWR